MLLEWFGGGGEIITTIQGPLLRQMAKETALKLNTGFIPLNAWLDQVRKYAGFSYRTLGRESKSVTEEQIGAWKIGVL
jgi:hypothetical protein